jgi:hypothetical protein
MFSTVYVRYQNYKTKKHFEKNLPNHINDNHFSYKVNISNPSLHTIGVDLLHDLIKTKKISHIKLQDNDITTEEYNKIIFAWTSIRSLWVCDAKEFLKEIPLKQIITHTSISDISFSNIAGVIEAFQARQSFVDNISSFEQKYHPLIHVKYCSSLNNYITIPYKDFVTKDSICILRLSQIGNGLSNEEYQNVNIAKEDSRLLLTIQRTEKYYTTKEAAQKMKSGKVEISSDKIITNDIKFFLENTETYFTLIGDNNSEISL